MKEQAKAPQKGREHAKGQKDVKGPAAKDTASKEAVHEEEDWNRDKSKSHGVASSSRSREHSASPTRRPKHGLQRSSRSSSMSERRKMGHHHAGGGHPWDMESLKQAIMSADSGKGEVKSLITKSLFSPRAPAFTALINMCGKEKMAEKALEVFETSQELKIEKNTYMYSALISALGSSGLWQKAFEIFERMLQETSDICKPNTITYSALISACERAGQVEEALDVFERMKAAGKNYRRGADFSLPPQHTHTHTQHMTAFLINLILSSLSLSLSFNFYFRHPARLDHVFGIAVCL